MHGTEFNAGQSVSGNNRPTVTLKNRGSGKRRFQAGKSATAKTPKPATGHEKLLKNGVGKTIQYVLMDGTDMSGTLVDSDKYTITVKVFIGEDCRTVCYFKHGVESFSIRDEPEATSGHEG